jgi:hypothetical protein
VVDLGCQLALGRAIPYCGLMNKGSEYKKRKARKILVAMCHRTNNLLPETGLPNDNDAQLPERESRQRNKSIAVRNGLKSEQVDEGSDPFVCFCHFSAWSIFTKKRIRNTKLCYIKYFFSINYLYKHRNTMQQ